MPFGSDFPTTPELQRTRGEHEYYQLYNADIADPKGQTDRGKFRLKEFFENDEKKARILDVALHIAPVIVDAGTDFLFGRPVKIEVDGEEVADGETDEAGASNEKLEDQIAEIIRRTDLQRKLKESCALYQSVGHAHFKVYAEVGPEGKRQACIEEVPYDYWYPNWDNVPLGQESKDIRIVVYLTNVDASGKQTKYVYIENYYLDADKKAVCAKSLWEDSGAKIGQQVPLKTLNIPVDPSAQPEQGRPLTMVEQTGLTELPLVTLNARKTVKERFGQSKLKKVLPLLHEINDRLTQLSVQFLKHLNAKLQLPANSVVRDPRTGKIQRVDMDVILANTGDPEAKYITNDNPLIEQAFDHLEKLIRKVAKLTHTPDTFLTEDDKGGVEKAESLRTRLMMFLRRVSNDESTYDPAVEKLIRLALKIEGVENADDVPLKLTFDQALPKEWQADAIIWGDALAQGLASEETAVSRFQDIEGDELQAELDRIDADKAKLMQSQLQSTVDSKGAPFKPVKPDDMSLPQA